MHDNKDLIASTFKWEYNAEMILWKLLVLNMEISIKKIFTLIILLIGLSACTVRSTIEIYDSFDGTDSLLGEKHDIPPIMLYPKNIFLKDSFLVVFNEKEIGRA